MARDRVVSSEPEAATLRRALRAWKTAAVGLLVALSVALAGGGWYTSKARRAARTVTLGDGATYRLVEPGGGTQEVRYESVKGVLVKITVVRDRNGRKVREDRDLEDEWNARLMSGR